MRIVTWNIRAGGGRRVEAIARQLGRWAPDVVALASGNCSWRSHTAALITVWANRGPDRRARDCRRPRGRRGNAGWPPSRRRRSAGDTRPFRQRIPAEGPAAAPATPAAHLELVGVVDDRLHPQDVYTFAGPVMPEAIMHKGASLTKVINHQWLTTEGVFGVSLGTWIRSGALCPPAARREPRGARRVGARRCAPLADLPVPVPGWRAGAPRAAPPSRSTGGGDAARRWSGDPRAPPPAARRQSGTARTADALGVTEVPGGRTPRSRGERVPRRGRQRERVHGAPPLR